MKNPKLFARPIQTSDIPLICDYWMGASPAYLKSMGADYKKLPSRDQFKSMLEEQIKLPPEKQMGFATIWCLDDQPIGHCNINQIEYGDRAKMHLHIWNPELRLKGMGSQFVKLSLNIFFERFKLWHLYCEPYANNPAPNKTLTKVGFTYLKNYRTIPGSINFEQEVSRWYLSRVRFLELKSL